MKSYGYTLFLETNSILSLIPSQFLQLIKAEITNQFIKRIHELESVVKAKLILYVNFYTFFIDERANNDIFGEAYIHFLIMVNGIDISFSFIKILNEYIRFITSPVVKMIGENFGFSNCRLHL